MAESRATRDGARTFVVSFDGVDRSWADWVDHWLSVSGGQGRLQRTEPAPSTPAAQALKDLLAPGLPVVLVLSPWFFRRSERPLDEWNRALRELSLREREQLRALVVGDRGLPDAVSVLAPQRLVDIPESAALRRMHAALDLPGQPPSPRDPAGQDAVRPRFPGAPAAVWGGVPNRNPVFTGRRELLDRLHSDESDERHSFGPSALIGMPGVGKSELAAEYAHRYRNAYEVVWWVPADERGKARDSLAALADRLRLDTGGTIGEKVRAVSEALRTGVPYRDWLVIFDNADDPAQVAPLLPDGTGRVVITSATNEWQNHGARLLEVEPYTEAEAVAFARRRAPRFNTDEARALAEALGGLPLAMDQGLAWLRDTDMSAAEYIRLVTPADSGPARSLPPHQVILQRVMDIRLSRMRDHESIAVQVLRLCACFGEGQLPTRLVRPTVAKDLPEGLNDVVSDPTRWSAALAGLKARALLRLEYVEPGVQQRQSGSGSTISLHRMIRQTVLAGMSFEERDEMVRAARQILAAADPGTPDDTATWPRYAEIVPHIIATEAMTSTNPVIQDLVANSVRYLYLRGENRLGRSLAERTLDEWAHRLEPRPARFWELRVQHGNLVRALAEYREAERLDRESVAGLAAERGEADLETLRALAGLGADLRALARYHEALEVSTQVRDHYQQLLGPEHPDTLRARMNLGITLQLLGRYADALELHRETASTAVSVMGAQHPHALMMSMATATDLLLLGRYTEALERQEHCVELCEDGLGLQHPSTLRARHRLARMQRRSGAVAEARQNLEQAVHLHDRLVGPDHPDALAVRADLGTLLRELGELPEAERIAEAVRTGFHTVHGPDHPYSVGADSNQAMIRRAMGARDEASSQAADAAARMAHALGPTHPWSIGTLLNSSACHNLAGEIEEAGRESRTAMERSVLSLGPEHPLTLSCAIATAADLRALGDRTRATELEDDTLDRLRRTLGANHVHTRSASRRERPYWDIEFLAT